MTMLPTASALAQLMNYGGSNPTALPSYSGDIAVPDGLMDSLAGAVPHGLQFDLPTAAPQMPQPQRTSPIRNLLGAIGDALLVANGAQPMYTQKLQQKQLGQALGQYLGNTDSMLAKIMEMDPESGLALYKLKHPEAAAAPEIIREMQAAGIDPTSPDGQAIIKNHLGRSSGQPTFIEELNALGIDPRSPQALELFYGKNSPAGYLLKPPAGASSLPHVTDQASYDAVPPGQQYTTPDGHVRVKPGGPTASAPSASFR